MTDVRLVATNPEDGVLVPVASNSSGQLAVQSPIIEKVPNDLEVEGNVTANKFLGDGSSLVNLPSAPPPTPPFDGNLDGDLTVSGSTTATAGIYDNGKAKAFISSGDGVLYGYDSTDLSKPTSVVTKTGDASFKGTISTDKNIAAVGNASIEGNIVAGYGDASSGCKLNSNGTASFAGIKAGFTAAGELIFTSRNVRYKLVVSDGFLFPEPYTREMEIKEKLER